MLLSAPGLSVVALVLFVLFVSLVAAVLFPVQLLDPAWQLRLAGTLINTAAFPLLGLALLQIAAELGPHDPQLKNRARLCSQLAVAAALGFLLLLPLQTVAGLQQGRSLNNAQAARIQGAEAKLKALRQVVASATSNADLNLQLQKLSGPVLGPADIAQPLPLLKAQVAAVLDQAAQQIARERQATPPADPWRLLPELLRNSIACLALALGFAALAVRPGSPRTLLQEWQKGWSNLLKRLRHHRTSRDSGPSSNAEYFRQIRGEERDS
ncbi:MAG: HpsJ family protein [Synechococcaceae cyanobacterium ELA263]